MAESQTFYLSHAPAMEVLQHRGNILVQMLNFFIWICTRSEFSVDLNGMKLDCAVPLEVNGPVHVWHTCIRLIAQLKFIQVDHTAVV